ncbi:UDP-N-acetylmuramate dehydrogenase [Paramicrobacterium humi]|uniref:UDP-N-acetylenolpyruvoylglucosamine reductase n=1 Tax=Paramicrobacterium humi TaxID=640635 RepID=A0A1H4J9Q2_9MICO|nr:UDP-N-acetylmuramate dehydrogenase [Microbacterium humi]SEB43064.1 UDP-N-acetylmuramate dehydrogenase [Microbacterium humi]
MSELSEPRPLRELTTLAVGGAPERMLQADDAEELVDLLTELWADDEPWTVLGGGSNTLAADDGIEGAVVLMRTRGIERVDEPDSVLLRVQAGENWDALVAHTVETGLTGIEALSGIPGSVGAAPIQNIGAYGQELSSVLESVELLDYESGERVRVPATELELGYRSSVLKRHGGEPAAREAVVLSVDLRLAPAEDGLSRPVAYSQLARALDVELGDRVPLEQVREAVLALRSSKGMVLDAADRDTHSAGSFFTNPIVTDQLARTLPAEAPRWPLATADAADTVLPLDGSAGTEIPPLAADAEPQLVKLSAAWLIERASIPRGFALPGSRAGISTKHTLALTNRGGATADDIASLARFVQSRVQAEFGILLRPEPVLLGIEL